MTPEQIEELPENERAVARQLLNRRCVLKGIHPFAWHSGTIVRFEQTPFGTKPVVDLDIGHEVCVMKPDEWELEEAE